MPKSSSIPMPRGGPAPGMAFPPLCAWRPGVPALLALALLYGAVSWASATVSRLEPGSLAVVRLGSGLGMAMALWFGARAFPALLLGSLVVSSYLWILGGWTSVDFVLLGPLRAVLDASLPFAGLWLWRRMAPRASWQPWRRLRDTWHFWLYACAVPACVVAPAHALVPLTVLGADPYSLQGLQYTLAMAGGRTLATAVLGFGLPLALEAVQRGGMRRPELWGGLVALLVLAVLTIAGLPGLRYLAVGPLVWLGWRCGLWAQSLGITILLTIWGAASIHGGLHVWGTSQPAAALTLITWLLALHFLLASLLIARTQLRHASRRLRSAVRQRTRELEQVNRELAELANVDSLTGVFNRRAFMHLGAERLRDAAAAGEPCFLMMIDLDHFKAINDRHGHAAGDEVLRAAARGIAEAVRRGDLVGRLGGEEFAALVRGGTLADARGCGERILGELRAVRLTAAQVSCSIGIAAVDGTALEQALRRADDALYVAKARGRARIEVARDDAAPPPASAGTMDR